MLRVLVLLLLFFSINSYAGIGKVTEEKGSAEIVRKKTKIDAKMDSGIESMDTVETVNGVVGITFDDNTKVRVTEHSKLLIDDFVYDPNTKGAGKLAMKVALGTVRYASGAVAKENHNNVAISTPTATVAVRGTAFTMTVDEIGQSLIILLPNVDGSVGQIDVSTGMGTVTLNQAFQATLTTVSEIKPLKPVLLALSESAIDNMLIVKPPAEVMKAIVDDNNKAFDALAFTELDRNYLEIKVIDYLAFNQLDMNALNVNYLTNALDSLIITSFVAGFDPVTSVYIFDKDIYWMIVREVKQNFTALVGKDRGYSIVLTQDGVTVQMRNQDNITNKIIVKQSAK
jgi:hypothetical protein